MKVPDHPASGLKRNAWLMISIQEQDHELTITDYLSLKCSPSWLLCTAISDDFLGVNRHLSVHLHKSRSVSMVDRMYAFTFLTLLSQISQKNLIISLQDVAFFLYIYLYIYLH